MQNNHRSPNEIEHDIEQERAEIAGTVNELESRLSPDAILREIGRGFSEHGGDIGHAISQSVKQNPVALALTGAGLAWMVFGRSYTERSAIASDGRYSSTRSYARESHMGDDDFNASAPSYSRGAQPRFDSARQSYASRRDYRAREAWARADIDDDQDHDRGDDDSWRERASGIAENAGSKAREARNKVGEGLSKASHGAQRRAESLRQRLAEGTDNMNEAARERVVAARSRFIDARQRAEAATRSYAAKGTDTAAEFIDEHPLVAGAVAMALGAALAGSLPRTRGEDEYFGKQSDELYDDAERIFKEEYEKARKVAKAAGDEASEIAREKRDQADAGSPGTSSAVETAADEIRKAGDRVADRAQEEARRQDLGKTDKSP